MKCKRMSFAFIVLFVGTVAGSMCFYGCKSAPTDDTTAIQLPPLPPLEEVDDVCAKMADDNFKKYCYDNFDLNNDGKVSMSEAAEAADISCDNATDFTGIEYFSNLEHFASISIETIDLRYNTELRSIELCYSNIRQIDLSYNQHLLFMDRSFLGCTSLTSVALPEGLFSVVDEMFSGCMGLTSITLPESLFAIGDGAFSSCTSLASITLPEGLLFIGDGAFSGCTSLASITLPEGLISIGDGAFSGCTSLASITLPEGLYFINERVFSECTSLVSIILPKSLFSIYSFAFSGCTGLISITLPEGLYSIDDFAFSGCVSLTSITFPASLEKIEKMAFVKCSSLNIVITNAISPPTLRSGLFSSIPRVFSGIGDSAILYTPSESVDAYKNSDWAQYFTQILAL